MGNLTYLLKHLYNNDMSCFYYKYKYFPLILFSVVTSLLSLKVSFLAHIPPLGMKVYKIVESQSSSSHMADYFLYNGGIAENGILHVKNMIGAGDAITIENSFLALWFDRSGLMEVCSQ